MKLNTSSYTLNIFNELNEYCLNNINNVITPDESLVRLCNDYIITHDISNYWDAFLVVAALNYLNASTKRDKSISYYFKQRINPVIKSIYNMENISSYYDKSEDVLYISFTNFIFSFHNPSLSNDMVEILSNNKVINFDNVRKQANADYILIKALENKDITLNILDNYKKVIRNTYPSILDRFLTYVKIDTQSDESSNKTPSTSKQKVLLNLLVKELQSYGAKVVLDKYYRVYAFIEGNNLYPTIALSSHVDTAPDFSGKDVNPQIINNYDGGIIKLGDSGLFLDPNKFDILNKYKNHTLITTDGTTLLGADDKAGVTIIMDFIKHYLSIDKRKRHPLSIIFTPDEEIGKGADHFNNDLLNAKYGYTLDGASPYHASYENFNAFGVELVIKGKSIHPGDAKDKMVSAIYVLNTFINKLDPNKTPWNTSGYEGFNHVCDIKGDVSEATASFIIRNHDLKKAKEQIEDFNRIKDECLKLYPEAELHLNIEEQYLNMYEIIKDNMSAIEKLNETYKALNIPLKYTPTRGGTDGARFSFMGCPSPNLGTGSYLHHGPYEFLVLEEMELMVKILIQLFTISE